MKMLRAFTQAFGLHPLVGFGMFAVDWMLFAGELASAGVSWPFSVSVAVVLAVGCVLMQKYAYGDNWGTAAGKSLIIGVLTAIPTAIPSIVPFAGGVLGVFNGMLPQRARN